MWLSCVGNQDGAWHQGECPRQRQPHHLPAQSHHHTRSQHHPPGQAAPPPSPIPAQLPRRGTSISQTTSRTFQKRTKLGEHPSLPILLGGERWLLTKTKAPFAQRHQAFGSPARAWGSPLAPPQPPGGSQPTSSSRGIAGRLAEGARSHFHRRGNAGSFGGSLVGNN